MNLNLTDVVRKLLIINIIVFVVGTYILPQSIADQWLAVYYPMSERFQPVQLITYMFMHGGFTHLFFNMFGLYMFGPPIEYQWGPKRFLLYYIYLFISVFRLFHFFDIFERNYFLTGNLL